MTLAQCVDAHCADWFSPIDTRKNPRFIFLYRFSTIRFFMKHTMDHQIESLACGLDNFNHQQNLTKFHLAQLNILVINWIYSIIIKDKNQFQTYFHINLCVRVCHFAFLPPPFFSPNPSNIHNAKDWLDRMQILHYHRSAQNGCNWMQHWSD